MSEEPKSIWKKSWKGWRGLLLWFVALFVAVFFVVFLLSEVSRLKSRAIESAAVAFISALIFSTVGILIALFIRWICCWKNFRRFVFGAACFITLIALFYAEEDWRGWHDWNKYKREQAARGEKLDFKDFIPPPVPDDQNFAMAPIWFELINAANTNAAQKWYGKFSPVTEKEPWNLLSIYGDANAEYAPTNGSWQRATLTDLKPWQNFYRTVATNFPSSPQPQTPAQDILLALSKNDSIIEQLREASARPESRFPLSYDMSPPFAILLPHLATLKRGCQVLDLRALAELQNGDSQKALDDVKLSLRLADAERSEPFLISQLVRIAIFQITMQPIYEGLAQNKWSDAQLADLDAALSKEDFLADYKLATRGERALGIADIDFLRHPENENIGMRRPRFNWLPRFSTLRTMASFSSEDNSYFNLQTFLLGIGPSGWLRQNELRVARFETQWLLPLADENAHVFSPEKVKVADKAFASEKKTVTPENVLEMMFLPAWSAEARRFAFAQTSADLARVAIALERYRLANGDYPNSLDALSPQFMEKIPNDVIGGKPLNYRRTNDGQFILYSVGWNERDDGGVVAALKGNSSGADYTRGDLVWRYPQK